MNNKLMVSFLCMASLLSSCSDSKADREAELNQQATLLSCNLSRHTGCVYASMTFDTDGDYSTTEYWGFNVYENNIISETAVNQYEAELSRLRIGSKATLKTWSKLIKNIGRYKE